MDNQLEDIIRDIDVEILNKHAYNNNEKQNFIQRINGAVNILRNYLIF